mgnify:CR=1 FL=1
MATLRELMEDAMRWPEWHGEAARTARRVMASAPSPTSPFAGGASSRTRTTNARGACSRRQRTNGRRVAPTADRDDHGAGVSLPPSPSMSEGPLRRRAHEDTFTRAGGHVDEPQAGDGWDDVFDEIDDEMQC